MAIVFYRKDQIVDYQEGNHIDGFYFNRESSLWAALISFSNLFGLDLFEKEKQLDVQTPRFFDNEEECPEYSQVGNILEYRDYTFHRCLVDKNCLSEELRLEYVAIYKELLGLIEKVCDENLILKDEYKHLFKGYKIEESIYPYSPDRCYSKLTNLLEGEKEQDTPFDFKYIHEYVKEFVDKFEKYKKPEFQIVFC